VKPETYDLVVDLVGATVASALSMVLLAFGFDAIRTVLVIVEV